MPHIAHERHNGANERHNGASADIAHLYAAERELSQVSNADGLAEVVAAELRRLREVLAKIEAGEL